jgi:hypothetical protein
MERLFRWSLILNAPIPPEISVHLKVREMGERGCRHSTPFQIHCPFSLTGVFHGQIGQYLNQENHRLAERFLPRGLRKIKTIHPQNKEKKSCL